MALYLVSVHKEIYKSVVLNNKIVGSSVFVEHLSSKAFLRSQYGSGTGKNSLNHRNQCHEPAEHHLTLN